MAQRIVRSPALWALLIFIGLFALLGVTEFICVTLGAAFDVRAG